MMYDIDALDIELRKTEAGSRLLSVFNAHVDEVFYLVSHHRQVMVAWQRNQGPAFVSAFLESGVSPDAKFRKEINGVSLQSLIRRMAAALQDAGSPPLRKAIGDNIALIMEWAGTCESMNHLLEKLKSIEAIPAGTTI
jgi:Zn-dependent M16 (insulinase) family peptidase